MAIPWEKIEREYITTTISQREIAEKYKTTSVSVNRHATAGDWIRRREEYMREKKQGHDDAKLSPREIPGLIHTVQMGSCEGAETDDEDKQGSRPRFRKYALATLSLKPIRTEDPIEVENRIADYFSCCYQHDIKPQKPGLAKWIGVSRSTLDAWYRGGYRKTTHQAIIEKAYGILEEDLYEQLQSGQISPPSGIFLLKNMFGYKDQQDVVITPKNPLGDLRDPEELRKRIEGIVVIEEEDGGDG